MKTILIFLSFVILLCFVSCDINEPPIDNTPPGRRDYIWTVDTLFMPFNSFTDITGTSPTDVWACGPGGDLDKTFYHYDGQKWDCDFISRPITPKSISSFCQDNVWSGGRQGMIWKYNGTQWEQDYKHSITGNDDITFECILTISEDNIFCAG